MKTETFHLELLTPCFCGGAEPDKQAEIRAPSIRGQLRWWFRTLGGFKSLAPMSVRDQEAMVFGSTAGDEGRAGKLVARVRALDGRSPADSADHQTPNMTAPEGYLFFPLRQQVRKKSALRAFDLAIRWGGQATLWDDLRALVAVFGHLGAIGFRGRRAMGALAFVAKPPLALPDATLRFTCPGAVTLRQLPATSASNAIAALGGWLKSCRAHGRSGQNDEERLGPFFRFASTDHDIGYRMHGTERQPAFRPALGLPIIQRTRQGANNWEWDWSERRHRAQGRFASPVLLRPHRDADGRWHGLVIFVDAHRWPEGKAVYLNGQERAVSFELYEAMKRDPALQPFP